MTDRPAELPLPYWIDHGPLPPYVPESLWAEKNRAKLSAWRELHLRGRRSFDGHAFASWNRVLRWDFQFDRSGDVLYLISRAPLEEVLPAAAAQGFVERHHETLAGGVVRAELLISFMDHPPQRDDLRPYHCQMQVWLGDTPLIRSVLDRRYDAWDGWMAVADEDRVLLSLAYEDPGLAADIIARDGDRKIQHASLDARASSFGLDAKLAEARARAEQIPAD